jgi:hypothetical protein
LVLVFGAEAEGLGLGWGVVFEDGAAKGIVFVASDDLAAGEVDVGGDVPVAVVAGSAAVGWGL